MTYELYDFDHKLEKPCILKIHPYEISITEEHIKNLKKLSRHATHTIGCELDSDKGISTTCKTVPAQAGEHCITATARLVLDIEPDGIISNLYPMLFEKRKMIYDLCTFLTFITGRNVHIDSDFLDAYHLDPIDHQFFIHKDIDLLKIGGLLLTKGLAPSFIAISEVDRNFMAIMANTNACIDVICNKTYTKYSDELSQSIGAIIPKVKALSKEIICKADCTEIKDAQNAFDCFSPKPSAFFKLLKLCEYLCLITDDTNYQTKAKHIKYLNKARNAFTHAGTLVSGDNTGYSISCTMVCREIAQLYFMKKFGFNISSLKHVIKDFIDYGKHNGVDIFNETYNQYLERIGIL